MAGTQHTDVVVVGAGVAGLNAARHLTAAGLEVVVLEAGDAPGGRMRTDTVDGFHTDRGFQPVCTAFPQVARLELAALAPGAFASGAMVHSSGSRMPVADARRIRDTLGGWGTWGPLSAARARGCHSASRTSRPPRAATRGPAPTAERVRVAAALGRLAATPVGRLMSTSDTAAVEARVLQALPPALTCRTVAPLLSALLLDPRLDSSARFAELVLRAFLRGPSVLPAGGVQRLPELLAADLSEGALRCRTRVEAVSADRVRLDDGAEVRARGVVVATEASAAVRLLPGLRRPAFRGVTTFYHVAEHTPDDGTLLTVDADPDSPLSHCAVPSAVAPGYSPDHRALVATTVPGCTTDGSTGVGASPAELERVVRERLAVLYGISPGSWTHLCTYRLPEAVPVVEPGHNFHRPVRVLTGLYVCGDHRDSSSVQGALASGARAARAVLTDLKVPAHLGALGVDGRITARSR